MPNVTPDQSLEDVYLYVLMRSDLASMNPGKACAQATHAANECVYQIRRSGDPSLNAQLVAWEGDRGFGPCIVLGVNDMTTIRILIEKVTEHEFHAGITHDPSYPVRDGLFTHLVPLDTCAYVFGLKHLLEPFLSEFPLMP